MCIDQWRKYHFAVNNKQRSHPHHVAIVRIAIVTCHTYSATSSINPFFFPRRRATKSNRDHYGTDKGVQITKRCRTCLSAMVRQAHILYYEQALSFMTMINPAHNNTRCARRCAVSKCTRDMHLHLMISSDDSIQRGP